MEESFYYTGSCEDAEEDIKKRFAGALNDPTSGHILCIFDIAECAVKDVKIYCGTADVSRRRKRGVGEKEVNILGLIPTSV